MFGELIEINNKRYTLKFSMNTFCKMDADGIDVMRLNDEEMSFSTLRALFYYGLQKYHSDTVKSHDDAGEIIEDYIDNGGDFEELTQTLMKSLVKAIGVKKAMEVVETPKKTK